MEADPVELGVELLAAVERDTITLAEAVDRLETITTDPTLTRRILDEADRRGAIERDGAIITPKRGRFVRFESQVEAREGDFACRRCGTELSTGHFIVFESGDLGPFGSECIRKVTGRD